MNTKKWIPVMVLTILLMATSFLMVQSDDSEAEYTENATHLQGTFGYSTNNMTGKVEFVTSNDTTITAFSYKIIVNVSTYTVVVNNSSSFNFNVPGTSIPTLYWDWSASNPSNIVLWESSTSGNTHSFAISNTSGLSGGVKYVSASNASSADIPLNCPKTITNMDFPSITISQDSAISNWDCRVRYYTVTFTATDYGTVSAVSVSVPQGSTIRYSGNTVFIENRVGQTITATPDTATAQYTYSFTGWSGVSTTATTITSDMTVTANFTRTVNEYTVTFSADPSLGSVSPTSVTVPYGTTITESGNTLSVGGTTVTATPNPTDIQYTYYFDSWTIPQSTVEGNMTVTASFTTTVNNYVIGIESSNTAYGTVDESLVYAPYGTAYSVSGNTLTIGTTVITATPTVGDVQYTYSLSGWSVSNGTVTGNMSIVANFVQTVREYTVTITVNNPSYGTVNKNSVTVPYGSTMVVMGGGVLGIGNQTVTTSPTPATIDTNYWFGGWTFPPGNPSGSEITHNITVTANFESGVRYYEITFVTLPVGYGTLDIDYPYSSSGGYHVSYGSTISVSDNELTIDGLTDMTATARPSAQEVDWTYVFDNWTIPAYTVTGDMTINANFTRTANTVVNVTVSTPQGHFYEGGNAYISHVFRVPVPSSVSQDRDTGTLYLWNYEITADMTASDELYDYTFFIWDGVPVGGGSVSDGMNISAIYHSEDRYYEVNFSIADGFGTLTTERVMVLYNTLIYSENNVVVVGANTIIATPTENGENVTYEFVRWDGLPMSGRILEDTDISAKIQRTVTADAFNIVEIEHGEVERVWSIPDEYLPLMLVIPVMLLIGLVLLSLNRKSDGDDYESY